MITAEFAAFFGSCYRGADLKEDTMRVYLCRWPNGDCSIVSARNKDDGIWKLDETGAAAPEYLRVLHSCLIDLKLTDDGQLELERMGDDTMDAIDTAYPILTEAQIVACEAEENG